MRRATIAIALAVLGCDPPLDDETVGCSTTTQCERGTVCDVIAGQCVPEPESGFIGGFRCRIRGPNDPNASLLGSEIMGSVGGQRWAFTGGPTCQISSNGRLTISAFPVYRDEVIVMTLDGATASGGGTLPLHQARIALEPGTASVLDFAADAQRAHSASGLVMFATPPAIGAEVQGFLNVAMHAVGGGKASFGVPCPRGTADCGTLFPGSSGGAYCELFEFTDGSSSDMCSRSCSTDADCAAGSGVCVVGACTRPCASNNDCVAPLSCLSGNPGESNGCF